MKKKLLPIAISLLIVNALVLPANAQAAAKLVGKEEVNGITGINNINVNGRRYNATFVDGSFNTMIALDATLLYLKEFATAATEAMSALFTGKGALQGSSLDFHPEYAFGTNTVYTGTDGTKAVNYATLWSLENAVDTLRVDIAAFTNREQSSDQVDGWTSATKRLKTVDSLSGNYIKWKAVAVTTSTEEQLGRALFSDANMSVNRNKSCASCHSLTRVAAPGETVGLLTGGLFIDPKNTLEGTAASEGSMAGTMGTLNAPSVGYAAFSPFFHWDSTKGVYVGGQFWNGRAATLEEQAKIPFLNADEMAMPSKWAVVSRLKEVYKPAFKKVYGFDLNKVPTNELAPASARAPASVEVAYNLMAKAIVAFEKSPFFNRFTSKYDFYLAGKTQLSAEEARGLAVFKDPKSHCSECHSTELTIAPDGGVFPPLLSNYSHHNSGLPRNITLVENHLEALGTGGRPEIAAKDPLHKQEGRFKTPSLRNVALTAPYGQNGVFKTLEQCVRFYANRDTLGVVDNNLSFGFGVTGWPASEIPQNKNTKVMGNLALTEQEITDIVAFLKTLTDNYPLYAKDPNVPRGTPSPFAKVPFPPMP